MYMEGASVRNENTTQCLREGIKVQWCQRAREYHMAYQFMSAQDTAVETSRVTASLSETLQRREETGLRRAAQLQPGHAQGSAPCSSTSTTTSARTSATASPPPPLCVPEPPSCPAQAHQSGATEVPWLLPATPLAHSKLRKRARAGLLPPIHTSQMFVFL